MVKFSKTLTFFTLAMTFGSVSSLWAAKTYQVTGPVVDVTDKTVTVQKGSERWEIDKTPDMKVSGDLKKGDKVTVHYTMAATEVDVKEGIKKEVTPASN